LIIAADAVAGDPDVPAPAIATADSIQFNSIQFISHDGDETGAANGGGEEDVGGLDAGDGAAGDGDYWERDDDDGGRHCCSLVPKLPFPAVAPPPRQRSDATRGRDLPHRVLQLLQLWLQLRNFVVGEGGAGAGRGWETGRTRMMKRRAWEPPAHCPSLRSEGGVVVARGRSDVDGDVVGVAHRAVVRGVPVPGCLDDPLEMVAGGSGEDVAPPTKDDRGVVVVDAFCSPPAVEVDARCAGDGGCCSQISAAMLHRWGERLVDTSYGAGAGAGRTAAVVVSGGPLATAPRRTAATIGCCSPRTCC
jgi:hypothetical protein